MKDKTKFWKAMEIIGTIGIYIIAIFFGALVFSKPYYYKYEERGDMDFTDYIDKLYRNTTYYLWNGTDYNLLDIETEYMIQFFIDADTYPFTNFHNTDEANSNEVYINNSEKTINIVNECAESTGQCTWDVLSLKIIIARTDLNGWYSILGVKFDVDAFNDNVLGFIWTDTDGNPRPLNVTDAGAIGTYQSGKSTVNGFYFAINEAEIMNEPNGTHYDSEEIVFYDNFGYLDTWTLNYTLIKS